MERVDRCDPILLNVHDHYSCIDFTRYSHLTKLVAVMGWVLRFVSNLKLSIAKNERLRMSAELEPDEVDNARVCVFSPWARNY